MTGTGHQTLTPTDADDPAATVDLDALGTPVTQVTTVGRDGEDALAGVAALPIHRMVLVHPADRPEPARRLVGVLENLGVEVDLAPVEPAVMPALRTVRRVVAEAADAGDEVLVNAGSGPRPLMLGAVLAAYLEGAKAFDVRDGRPHLLPVLRLEATEVVSDAKMDLLRTLRELGGRTESLAELGEAAGMDKSSVSYHIRGARGAPGLEEAGLVEVERGHQGRLGIRLTAQGEVVLFLDGRD